MEENQGNTWTKTVFAVFKNDLLKKELKQWADSNEINIFWGVHKPDIVARPYFAAIIDRKILGKEAYSLYLDVLQEVNTPIDTQKLKETHGIEPYDLTGLTERDEHICVIVDHIKDIEYPLLDFVLQVNTEHKNAIRWIIQNIDLSYQLIRDL